MDLQLSTLRYESDPGSGAEADGKHFSLCLPPSPGGCQVTFRQSKIMSVLINNTVVTREISRKVQICMCLMANKFFVSKSCPKLCTMVCVYSVKV